LNSSKGNGKEKQSDLMLNPLKVEIKKVDQIRFKKEKENKLDNEFRSEVGCQDHYVLIWKSTRK